MNISDPEGLKRAIEDLGVLSSEAEAIVVKVKADPSMCFFIIKEVQYFDIPRYCVSDVLRRGDEAVRTSFLKTLPHSI